MGRYTALTVGLSLAVAACLLALVRSRRQLVVILRTATVVTLLSYPWDFFAIHWHAWAYGEEVPKILGVPVFDLIFIFVCTVLTASLFSRGERADELGEDSNVRRSER
jgi:lycopene cyclase domain-containing protein